MITPARSALALPGRWAEVRPPSLKELRATSVLGIPIQEASAKIRTGPPVDEAQDYGLPCWAGELPLSLVAGALVSDPKLAAGRAAPESVRLRGPFVPGLQRSAKGS